MGAREQVESGARPHESEAGALKRRVLVVAGMHHGGAYDVARCLSSLGVGLPRTRRESGIDGDVHWGESEPIVELHDELLASVGGSWDDVSPFPRTWYSSPDAADYRARMARAVEAEYAGSTLFVVNDPRICRLVPFWVGLLDDLGLEPAFVLTVRNPLEVAASLEQRDRIPVAKGLLIWLRHVLDAERDTREHSRALVAHEDVLGDWRASVRAISDAIGFTWPLPEEEAEAQANGLPASEQPPQPVSPTELDWHPDSVDWVRQAYEVLHRACRSGDAPDRDALDALDRALADAARASAPVLAEWRLRVAAVAGRLDYTSKQLEAREREFSTFKDDLEARDREIASLKEQIASIRRSVSWRVTKPIRGVKALIKKILRRQ